MITNYKIYEMKKEQAEIEFYKKIKDQKIYNEIEDFVKNEIDPYCNNSVMSLFDDFKNFGRAYNITNIKNLKTTEYKISLTPGKYYKEDNGGYGANISYFIVEDKNTNSVIDSYFKLEIYGFNYKKRAGKYSAKFQTPINDPQLKQLLHLSNLSVDKKIELYINLLDINILKNIVKKIDIKDINLNASDHNIREDIKWWLYEDEMVSDPLKKAVIYQAKKLGIVDNLPFLLDADKYNL